MRAASSSTARKMGISRNSWFTATRRPARLAASMTASASSRLDTKGFSHRTSAPAASARRQKSACVAGGVATMTTSGRESSRRRSMLS
jgi:hypothetical protein